MKNRLGIGDLIAAYVTNWFEYCQANLKTGTNRKIQRKTLCDEEKKKGGPIKFLNEMRRYLVFKPTINRNYLLGIICLSG